MHLFRLLVLALTAQHTCQVFHALQCGWNFENPLDGIFEALQFCLSLWHVELINSVASSEFHKTNSHSTAIEPTATFQTLQPTCLTVKSTTILLCLQRCHLLAIPHTRCHSIDFRVRIRKLTLLTRVGTTRCSQIWAVNGTSPT